MTILLPAELMFAFSIKCSGMPLLPARSPACNFLAAPLTETAMMFEG